VTSTSSDKCGVYVGVAANSPNAGAVKAEGAPACY
jgi:hypothetical protein